MKHEIHIDRDGETHITVKSKDLSTARAEADKLIQKAHDGIYGIGRFELHIFEMSVDGYYEKCVLAGEPFYVPARAKETA